MLIYNRARMQGPSHSQRQVNGDRQSRVKDKLRGINGVIRKGANGDKNLDGRGEGKSVGDREWRMVSERKKITIGSEGKEAR